MGALRAPGRASRAGRDLGGEGGPGYRRAPVSTRKLIAVALVAGLAILLAGGIQLVLLAGRGDDDGGDARALAELGTSVVIDGVDVAATAARREGPLLVLTVSFGAAGDGADADTSVDELARGWALFAPDADLVPRADPPAGAAPCPAVPVPDGTPVVCDVAFTIGEDPASGSYLASFQGAQSWRVPLPST